MLLLVAAGVCFALAMARWTTKVELVALGLLFWLLSVLLPAIQNL